MRKLSIGFCSVFGLCLLFFLLYTFVLTDRIIQEIGYVIFAGDTNYSLNFDEEIFRNLTMPLSCKQVLEILGNPLSTFTREYQDVWLYEPSPEPNNKDSKGRITYNLFGPFSKVYFDEEGIAKKIMGDYLPKLNLGMDKQKIVKLYGLPNSISQQLPEIVFGYSNSGVSGTYKLRDVVFNKACEFIKVEAYIYFD